VTVDSIPWEQRLGMHENV